MSLKLDDIDFLEIKPISNIIQSVTLYLKLKQKDLLTN